MIKTLLVVAILVLLYLGVTAYEERTTSETASDAGQAVGQAGGDAVKATGTAAGDAPKTTGERLVRSKDEAVKAAQETLDGVERKWRDLQAKAEPATDEAKTDLQRAKVQIGGAFADAKAKLVEARDAGADTWHQDVKPALDAALQKVQKLYEDTSAKLSSK